MNHPEQDSCNTIIFFADFGKLENSRMFLYIWAIIFILHEIWLALAYYSVVTW